jgi:hypothetical protein
VLTASLTIDFIALAIALAVPALRLVRYRRIRVDHVIVFCLGHAYYMSLSSIMLHTTALNNTYWFVYRYFADVSDSRRFWTSVWSLLVLLAFVAGAKAAETARRAPDVASRHEDPAHQRGLVVPSIALTLAALGLFALITVRYRAVVLEGYRSLDPENIQNQSGRGVLSASASAVVLSAVFMLHVTLRTGASRLKRPVWIVAALAIALPSAVLLLAGGRMYVATSCIALVVWFTHVRGPISRWLLVGAGAVGFALLTALGSVRTGELPSGETLGFYATSESVLTSISQGNFLSSEREVFLPARLPKYLASDISNIVPRAVLPGKDALRLDPEDEGFTVTSALGATHLQVSSLINFGFVGSVAAFGGLSYGFSRLKLFVLRHDTSVLSITYASCAGALTFSIFRDPFSISVVRWMLLNGVTLPLIYLVAVTVARRRPLSGAANRVTATHTPI